MYSRFLPSLVASLWSLPHLLYGIHRPRFFPSHLTKLGYVFCLALVLPSFRCLDKPIYLSLSPTLYSLPIEAFCWKSRSHSSTVSRWLGHLPRMICCIQGRSSSLSRRMGKCHGTLARVARLASLTEHTMVSCAAIRIPAEMRNSKTTLPATTPPVLRRCSFAVGHPGKKQDTEDTWQSNDG